MEYLATVGSGIWFPLPADIRRRLGPGALRPGGLRRLVDLGIEVDEATVEAIDARFGDRRP